MFAASGDGVVVVSATAFTIITGRHPLVKSTVGALYSDDNVLLSRILCILGLAPQLISLLVCHNSWAALPPKRLEGHTRNDRKWEAVSAALLPMRLQCFSASDFFGTNAVQLFKQTHEKEKGWAKVAFGSLARTGAPLSDHVMAAIHAYIAFYRVLFSD